MSHCAFIWVLTIIYVYVDIRETSGTHLKTEAVKMVESMTPGIANAKICHICRLKMCHSKTSDKKQQCNGEHKVVKRMHYYAAVR